MFRKLLSLMLVLMMILSFSACGRVGESDSDKDSEEISSDADDRNDDEDEDSNKDADKDGDENEDESTDKDEDADEGSGSDEDSDADESVTNDTGSSAMDIDISVDIPEGFTKQDDTNSILSYTNKDGAMFSVMKTYAPEGVKDPAGLAQFELEQIQAFFEDAEFQPVEETKLDGRDAARMSMDIEITSSMKQRQVYVYFFDGSNAYKVMGAFFTNDEAGEKAVEDMIQSVKIN